MPKPKKDIKDLLDDAEFDIDAIDLLKILAESKDEINHREAVEDVIEHLMTVDRPNFRRVFVHLLSTEYHVPVELATNIEMLFDIIGHIATLDNPEVNDIIYNTALENGVLGDRQYERV